MVDTEKIRAELSKLSEQQTRASQFVGWEPAELAAYQERAKRIALLHARLAAHDPKIEHLVQAFVKFRAYRPLGEPFGVWKLKVG
jgi:hypothetical protein